jgi:hypothetical protein
MSALAHRPRATVARTVHTGPIPDRPVIRGDGHPPWCTRDHRCTATRITGGEHISIPETWKTAHGRVIATRYQNSRGTWVEIRSVIHVHPHEPFAREQIRRLIAATHLITSRVLGRSTNR